MTARVLVVDDLEPNVKLLEAKLRAEYFEVFVAFRGEEAIKLAIAEQPDIILLDVMMPGIDGFETCQRLKANPLTCHIPVVMVTALDQQEDRVAGLESGADDFLSKPVEDVALFARVRSLTRLKIMTDELRKSHATGAEMGLLTHAALAEMDGEESAILVIDDTPNAHIPFSDKLPENYTFTIEKDAKEAIEILRQSKFDLVIVNMAMESYDPLRLCSTIRSMDEMRLIPVLALVRKGDTRRLVRALDMGVNDYLPVPIDNGEMVARMKTQLRRRHYTEQLRASYGKTLELAVTDQLTGLYNRRYLMTHIESLFEVALAEKRPLAALVMDIDHFKIINDTHGHDAGDAVLRDLAKRLVKNVRGIDLPCRYGGEEFVFLMPDTDKAFAGIIAERLREEISQEPIAVEGQDGLQVNITVSIGVAITDPALENDTPEALLKRADKALYEAKETGRNKVVTDQAA
ncbi:MAG: PleD family two-component system response regulator [Parvularculaceae bacterium]